MLKLYYFTLPCTKPNLTYITRSITQSRNYTSNLRHVNYFKNIPFILNNINHKNNNNIKYNLYNNFIFYFPLHHYSKRHYFSESSFIKKRKNIFQPEIKFEGHKKNMKLNRHQKLHWDGIKEQVSQGKIPSVFNFYEAFQTLALKCYKNNEDQILLIDAIQDMIQWNIQPSPSIIIFVLEQFRKTKNYEMLNLLYSTQKSNENFNHDNINNNEIIYEKYLGDELYVLSHLGVCAKAITVCLSIPNSQFIALTAFKKAMNTIQKKTENYQKKYQEKFYDYENNENNNNNNNNNNNSIPIDHSYHYEPTTLSSIPLEKILSPVERNAWQQGLERFIVNMSRGGNEYRKYAYRAYRLMTEHFSMQLHRGTIAALISVFVAENDHEKFREFIDWYLFEKDTPLTNTLVRPVLHGLSQFFDVIPLETKETVLLKLLNDLKQASNRSPNENRKDNPIRLKLTPEILEMAINLCFKIRSPQIGSRFLDEAQAIGNRTKKNRTHSQDRQNSVGRKPKLSETEVKHFSRVLKKIFYIP